MRITSNRHTTDMQIAKQEVMHKTLILHCKNIDVLGAHLV